MKSPPLSFLAAFPLLLAACATQATPAIDIAAEEQAIRAQDARWMEAVRARDAAAEALLLADDAVIYREHTEPIVGPSAFQAYEAQQYTDNPMSESNWTTDAIHVAASGEIAIQTGSYEVSKLGAKGDGMDRGKFVTVWKKSNGEWKVWHDVGSTTLPMSEAGMMHPGG